MSGMKMTGNLEKSLEDLANLRAKLARALSKMVDPARTSQGYGYKYADLAAVNGILRPTLAAEGLAYAQNIRMDETSVRPRLVLTILDMETGASDVVSELVVPAPPPKMVKGQPQAAGPQEDGSQITYYRRYQLMAAFGLAAEDDDGALAQPVGASSPVGVQQRSKPAPKPAAQPAPQQPGKISQAQGNELWQAAQAKGLSQEELMSWLSKQTGSEITRLSQISVEDFSNLLEQLKS